jgi:hypothetical protein
VISLSSFQVGFNFSSSFAFFYFVVPAVEEHRVVITGGSFAGGSVISVTVNRLLIRYFCSL